MNESLPWLAGAVVALAAVFGYLNGVLDSASLVATAIASRSLAPRWALGVASAAAFVGPFLFGNAVAATIGTQLIRPEAVNPLLFATALSAAIAWNLVAVLIGLPTSSSHALVGGLIGAALVDAGPTAVLPRGLAVILFFLVVGPLCGLLAGFLGLRLALLAVRGASPAVSQTFRRLQVVTVVVLALSFGTNDAQKVMGVVVATLVAVGWATEFAVPLWVVALSAGALALGVAAGGARVIRTLGASLYRVRPIHSLSAQTTAALVTLLATLAGGPLSTGQVVSAAIIGVGSAYRPSAVRWLVARSIITAWLLTMPVAALASAALYWLLSRLL